MKLVEKIKILGVSYSVYVYEDYRELNEKNWAWEQTYNLNWNQEEKGCGISGYCDISAKEIHIYIGFSEEYDRGTLRHELCHAYLYEMGYSHWNDEDLIQKLTQWIPMIQKIENNGWEKVQNARVEKESRSKKDCEESIPNSK